MTSALPTIVFALIGIVVLGAAVAIAAGRLGDFGEVDHDRQVARLPEGAITPADVDGLRFGLGLRGYRMDQVDDVLDRLSAELRAKDQRLAQLEASVSGETGTITGGGTSSAATQ